jgi:NADP-dependent 3-hydroxy acid dehydrogenase YdfG
MPDRAALVTGASSGIGLAIADVLGAEGYGLTLVARRPEKLAAATEELRGKGYEVVEVAANLAQEEDIQRVVAAHRDRYARLDVLVNSAGVGVGAAEQVKPEDMIQPSDVSEAVRYLLRLSPACVVPEIVFQRQGEAI